MYHFSTMQKVYYKAIIFSQLPLNEQESYKPLLISSACEFIGSSIPSPNYLLGIEARLSHGQLIGLALAKTLFEAHVAELQSLMVVDTFRRKGVGTHLLQFLESTLKQIKIYGLSLSYEQSTPSAPALEKILERLHWPRPRFYLIRCFYDDYSRFAPPWFKKYVPPTFPPGMSIFLWKDLTAKEKEKILFQMEQGVFLPYLSPFQDEKNIEYLTSVGLRFEQEVIGWSISHRIAPDTIRYSILYIDKQYQIPGYVIWLLVTSLHLQIQANIRKSFFEVNRLNVNQTWWNFVLKKLAAYADRIEKWNNVIHAL